jgi:hypothetical protein
LARWTTYQQGCVSLSNARLSQEVLGCDVLNWLPNDDGIGEETPISLQRQGAGSVWLNRHPDSPSGVLDAYIEAPSA